jgi:hypothetical protein
VKITDRTRIPKREIELKFKGKSTYGMTQKMTVRPVRLTERLQEERKELARNRK